MACPSGYYAVLSFSTSTLNAPILHQSSSHLVQKISNTSNLFNTHTVECRKITSYLSLQTSISPIFHSSITSSVEDAHSAGLDIPPLKAHSRQQILTLAASNLIPLRHKEPPYSHPIQIAAFMDRSFVLPVRVDYHSTSNAKLILTPITLSCLLLSTSRQLKTA